MMRDIGICSRAKEVNRMKGKGKNKGKKPRIAREIRGESYPYEEGTTNPHLKAVVLEVVENQLRENNPPETRQTFERLLATGYSRQEAIEMIGSAVVGEIWAVLKENKPYDAVRFKAALEKVPEEG
jgi:Domain of unknown function (DUF1841)